MPTPRELGYAMLPAWARQQRHWLAWPTVNWRGELDAAREDLAELVRLLSEEQVVSILANPEEVADVSLMCGPGVGALSVPHARCGMRALGPTFVAREGGRDLAGIVWSGDEADVAAAILQHQRLARFDGPLPIAGAMVDVDGLGTALASEALLAGGAREDTEQLLRAWLGVEEVLWIDAGLEGDLSNGAVLNAARFLKPGLAIVAVEQDPDAPDAARLTKNRQRIEGARDAFGRKIETVAVPLPKRRLRLDGSRIAMSYTDCFISGNLVILPAYEDARDAVAYDRVVQALMEHTVISYPAVEFVLGGCGLGSLILTQPVSVPAAH